MARISFVFDVIVKNIAMPKLKTEDYQKLQVEAQFNNRLINITSSRIKVSDFNPNASIHFTETDEVLRRNIGDCGMLMSVRMNKRDIGSATAEFPDSFIDKIKADMSDLVHEGSLTLVTNKQEVGKLEFKCRLIIKCATAEEKDCRRYLDNSIRPQDILFILGESQKCIQPCDPCAAVEPEEGDERLAMDLQRYRSVPGSKQPTKEASPTVGFTSELKKMAKECEETIDAILNGTNPPMLPLSKVIQSNNDDENSDKKSGSEKAEEQDVPEGTIPGVSPIRCCPICLNNMSWLPKFATCPRCGSKPMPVVEKKPKKELTADEIILEFLSKPELTTEELCGRFKEEAESDEKKEEEVQCRCSCKKRKICAHCRVREACKDIFKLSSDNERSPGAGRDSKRISKAEPQRKSAVQDTDLEPYTDLELEPELDSDIRGSVRRPFRRSRRSRRDGSVPGTNSPQSEASIADMSKEEFDERRTFLARVFSELCLLYNIKTNNTAEQEKEGENSNQSDTDTNITSMGSAKRDSKRESKKDTKRDSTRDSNVKRISTKSNKSKKEKRNLKRATKRPKWRSNISNANESSEDSLPSVISQESLDVSEDDGQPLIPARLGWDWRTDPASKKGWRPGAVRKPIKKIMDFFLQKNSKIGAAEITKKLELEQLEKERNALSMLQVSKQNGEISITFRSVDPDKPEDPIIYKVLKSDQAVRLSEMKKKFKEDGFRKCTCHQSLMLCVCRTTEEKSELQDALKEECASRRIQFCPDELVLTDTTDSEMEYDFEVSPLMGAPISPPVDGPNSKTINRATQTAEEDLAVKRKYPNLQENPYYIPYNCATRNVFSGQNGQDEEEGGDSARNKENGGGDNRGSYFSRGRNNQNQNQPNRGRGFGNNNTRDPGNRNARDSGNKSGNNKRNDNKSGGKPGEKGKGGSGNGNKSSGIPVALPKRLQKDPKAAEKAEAADKKKKDEEKQKTMKKKFIEMTKAPPIDKNKTRRALLTKILPDVDNIPRLGKATAALDNCPCDPCAMVEFPCNPCITPNASECCPCYYYCC